MNIDTMCNYDNSCNTVAEEESLTLFQQIYHCGSFILFKLVEGTIPPFQLHLNSVCILTFCSLIILYLKKICLSRMTKYLAFFSIAVLLNKCS